jgi:serine/threonine protein kinase
VCLATINRDKRRRSSAAKIAKDSSVNSPNVGSILQELKILANVGSQLNVIQLQGCYTQELTSRHYLCIFLEYCGNGDLSSWLKKNALNFSTKSMIEELTERFLELSTSDEYDEDNRQEPLRVKSFNESDLIFLVYQIAKGMEYLESNLFLHKDLSARNILLTDNFEIKISDFGMADACQLVSIKYFGRANV